MKEEAATWQHYFAKEFQGLEEVANRDRGKNLLMGGLSDVCDSLRTPPPNDSMHSGQRNEVDPGRHAAKAKM